MIKFSIPIKQVEGKVRRPRRQLDLGRLLAFLPNRKKHCGLYYKYLMTIKGDNDKRCLYYKPVACTIKGLGL